MEANRSFYPGEIYFSSISISWLWKQMIKVSLIRVSFIMFNISHFSYKLSNAFWWLSAIIQYWWWIRQISIFFPLHYTLQQIQLLSFLIRNNHGNIVGLPFVFPYFWLNLEYWIRVRVLKTVCAEHLHYMSLKKWTFEM